MGSVDTAPGLSAQLAGGEVAGRVGPHRARAYLAGLGTAGALLAGAALLFVLASAFVAFKGFPQLGAQPLPVSVVVGPVASHAAPTSARLAGALATVAGGGGIGGAAGTAVGAGPTGAGPGAATRLGTAGRLTSGGSTGSTNPHTPPPTGTRPPTGPGSTGGSGGTGSLGGFVTSTGSHLGSTVDKVAGRLADGVRPISPGAAGVIHHAGNLAGGAISGASGTVGGLLPGHK